MESNASWIAGTIDEFTKAAHEAPAIYFAPVRGAVQGVVSQWQKLRSRNGSRAVAHKRA